MAEKIFNNVRLTLKIDTLENWGNSTLKLKNGEVALATVAASAGTGLTEPVVMAKIGTAEEKTFSELPWAFHAKAADVLEACKSEAGLKTFINNVIAEAGIATSDALTALAGRVTTAEGEIDTLQSEMDAVEAKAAANETAIGTLQGLVGDESVAKQIQDKITALNLANTYEAKGEAAKVQTALDTYKTSNDKAVADNKAAIETEAATARAAEKANADAITAIKDGTTIDSFADVETALAGKEASGAAAQALTDAKAYADGLAGNYDAKGAAATAETNAKAYADGLAKNYDAAGAADGALAAAKEYADGEIAEWVGDKTVGVQISEAIANEKLAETYAAKVHKHVKADITDFAHTHEMSEVNGLEAALEGKQAAGDYATKTEAQGYANAKDAAIEAAQAAADKAQEEVDALETYVGTIPSDEKYADITNVVAYINKKAEETLASASGNSTETAASVKAALDTYKAENDAKVNANTEAIAALEVLVGDKSVATQIETAVAAEKTRAEAAEKANADAIAVLNGNTAVEGSVDKKVADAINEFATQMSDDETVNTYKELINYAATHGAEFTELVGEVDANTKAIATLNGDATTAGSVDKKIADAIAAENLSQYATDTDLNGVDTRLQAVEAAVGETGSVATAIEEAVTEANEYTDALAEGAVADNAAAIATLNGLVGDTAVATQISNVTNPLAERVVALEAVDHEHANKTVLDGVSAEKVAAWDAAVQTVTAGTGLKATKTGTDVAIDFDETTTWIFDCGTSAE